MEEDYKRMMEKLNRQDRKLLDINELKEIINFDKEKQNLNKITDIIKKTTEKLKDLKGQNYKQEYETYQEFKQEILDDRQAKELIKNQYLEICEVIDNLMRKIRTYYKEIKQAEIFVDSLENPIPDDIPEDISFFKHHLEVLRGDLETEEGKKYLKQYKTLVANEIYKKSTDEDFFSSRVSVDALRVLHDYHSKHADILNLSLQLINYSWEEKEDLENSDSEIGEEGEDIGDDSEEAEVEEEDESNKERIIDQLQELKRFIDKRKSLYYAGLRREHGYERKFSAQVLLEGVFAKGLNFEDYFEILMYNLFGLHNYTTLEENNDLRRYINNLGDYEFLRPSELYKACNIVLKDLTEEEWNVIKIDERRRPYIPEFDEFYIEENKELIAEKLREAFDVIVLIEKKLS